MSRIADPLAAYRTEDHWGKMRLDLDKIEDSCRNYTQPWEPDEVLALVAEIRELREYQDDHAYG